MVREINEIQYVSKHFWLKFCYTLTLQSSDLVFRIFKIWIFNWNSAIQFSGIFSSLIINSNSANNNNYCSLTNLFITALFIASLFYHILLNLLRLHFPVSSPLTHHCYQWYLLLLLTEAQTIPEKPITLPIARTITQHPFHRRSDRYSGRASRRW